MNIEYQEQIEAYAFPDTRDLTREYLKKYWLLKDELTEYWRPIMSNIFTTQFKALPDLVFNVGYKIFPMLGGVLFTQKDFTQLKKCMEEVGDKEFVIVEDFFDLENPPHDFGPPLRFKYPINIEWNHINKMLEEGISYNLFHLMERSFYVFGNTGSCGKYVANDYWDQSLDPAGTPLDIVGFKPEYVNTFKKQFKQTEKERNRVMKWLPERYKSLVV